MMKNNTVRNDLQQICSEVGDSKVVIFSFTDAENGNITKLGGNASWAFAAEMARAGCAQTVVQEKVGYDADYWRMVGMPEKVDEKYKEYLGNAKAKIDGKYTVTYADGTYRLYSEVMITHLDTGALVGPGYIKLTSELPPKWENRQKPLGNIFGETIMEKSWGDMSGPYLKARLLSGPYFNPEDHLEIEISTEPDVYLYILLEQYDKSLVRLWPTDRPDITKPLKRNHFLFPRDAVFKEKLGAINLDLPAFTEEAKERIKIFASRFPISFENIPLPINGPIYGEEAGRWYKPTRDSLLEAGKKGAVSSVTLPYTICRDSCH